MFRRALPTAVVGPQTVFWGAGAGDAPCLSLVAAPCRKLNHAPPPLLPGCEQAFQQYRVRTKTTLPQYNSPNLDVIRRYSDFAFLHQRLFEQNRGAPPPHHALCGFGHA